VRPCTKAWSVEDAVARLQREAGASFDPELVKLFVGVLPQILAVRQKYSDAPHAAP
jgi:putative two-component system response regulator